MGKPAKLMAGERVLTGWHNDGMYGGKYGEQQHLAYVGVLTSFGRVLLRDEADGGWDEVGDHNLLAPVETDTEVEHG